MKIKSKILQYLHLDPSHSLLDARTVRILKEWFDILDIHKKSGLNGKNWLLCSWKSDPCTKTRKGGGGGGSHWRIQGSARDTSPSVQIFSFSCSFWGKLGKIIGWHPSSGKSWICHRECVGSSEHVVGHSLYFSPRWPRGHSFHSNCVLEAMFLDPVNWESVADLRGGGARDAHPHLWTKISSFSCSFRKKNWSNNRLAPPPPLGLAHPPLGKPGSTTGNAREQWRNNKEAMETTREWQGND